MSMNIALTKNAGGFTLVEMAIVLLILGLILNGLMVAVGQSAENTRRLEVRNKLREIEEVLYGFAQVQGRLPCPADYNTSGFESVSGTTANGICSLTHGLLPNATLGISGGVDDNGLLMDPWGNPFRYSVAGTTVSGYRYTGSTSITNIYNNASTEVVNNANMLEVCDISDCSGVIMSDVVPAVVISMGKNWPDTATSSTAEQANGSGTTLGSTYSVSSTNIFVVTDYSEDNFDDMLIWISPHLLFSKMLSAGKLP